MIEKPKSIDELIDASSLGTPEVKAIRTEADPAVVARILQRADDLALADKLLGEVQELLAGRFGEQSADGYLEETRLAIAFALRSAYQRGKTLGYGYGFTAGSQAARGEMPDDPNAPPRGETRET